MQVGAERDDEQVGVEGPCISLNSFGRRVDRTNRGLHEAHAGLDDVGVRVPHVGGERLTEHHIELRETEDETVGFVDQHDVDIVAEFLRQPRRDL